MSDLLCRFGWHGGFAKTDTYCVSFGDGWALMECSRCGKRYVWEKSYMSEEKRQQLKEKERPPQSF